MIPKASQRGGGQQLATHLLNEFDNDRVEVAHVRGAIARDLHGAFAEWRAISRATQCRKYLYSLSLNPDPKQGPLTRTQYLDFIDRAEKRLGLADQPRAVVFHVKYGREHCHVVWSRINESSMKAVQLSHDHQNLRTVAREFARAHDLRLPRGMEQDRGADRYKERQEVENLPEQQQEERSGITKAERVAAITQAWQETKTGHALAEALRRRGYILARGDRRSFVVVDRAGEIHALARQISGANTRQVKARLADVALDKLPDAHRAQADAHRQLAAERDRAPQPPENRSAVPATPRERRDDLYARQARRRESATAERDALEKQHALETQALAEAQGREIRGVREAREKAKPGPVMAFIARITGFGLIVRGRQKRQDAQRASEHERQREALARRHHREIVSWRHREHGLASVEARERRSLETKIRREAFTRAVGRELAAEGSAGEGLSQQTLPSAQRGRPAPAGDADTMRVTDRSGRGELSRIFNDPLKQPEKARGTGGPEPEASKLSKDFARAVDGSAKTKDDQLARDLLEEFRKRAAGREQQRGARGRDRGRDRDR